MNYTGYDTKGSVENRPSYMGNKLLKIPQIINMLGLEYTRFVNMARLHRVQYELYFKGSRYVECLQLC